MSLFEEPNSEQETEMIEKLANTIYKYDMDLVAILVLESIKPLTSVYGKMGRFIVAPFIPLIGEESMPYLATFEKKENLEKLIRLLEERGKADYEIAKKMKEEAKVNESKKGKRRLWPF